MVMVGRCGCVVMIGGTGRIGGGSNVVMIGGCGWWS